MPEIARAPEGLTMPPSMRMLLLAVHWSQLEDVLSHDGDLCEKVVVTAWCR